MRIEAVECQKIVDRVIRILGKNINIMNSEGIIIASGNEDRIGTFHEAAKLAAYKKKEIVVDTETRFIGCKKGVNLPIYYGSEVIGVIGITGEPTEVKGYGAIVKELAEMMIQEEDRKKKELYHQQALRNFANELIKEQDEQSIESLRWRTQLVDFDIRIARIILVADICNFGAVIKRTQLDTEMKIQEYKQGIIDIIMSTLNPEHDIAFNLYEDRFIIIKSAGKGIEDYCSRLQREVKTKLEIDMNIGVGSTCIDIPDYYKSYSLANSSLEIGKRIRPQQLVYNWREYKLEILLQAIPGEKRAQYMSGFDMLWQERDGNEELYRTIKAYFENGMNLKNTAEILYVHRNTVLYRLNRAKEIYGIDIMNTYECMLLYIAIICKELT